MCYWPCSKVPELQRTFGICHRPALQPKAFLFVWCAAVQCSAVVSDEPEHATLDAAVDAATPPHHPPPTPPHQIPLDILDQQGRNAFTTAASSRTIRLDYTAVGPLCVRSTRPSIRRDMCDTGDCIGARRIPSSLLKFNPSTCSTKMYE